MGSVAGSSVADDSEMYWFSSLADDSGMGSVAGSLLAGELHWWLQPWASGQGYILVQCACSQVGI